jgi:ribosomal protein S18 acetylase RimI-like enzyme
VAYRFGGPEPYGNKKWPEGSMNLQFRRASPGDVEEAIPLIYGAGPLGLDYVYAVGRHRVLDFLRTAFVHGSSTLGYRSHVVAVVDGHVVGVAAFYDGAEHRRLNRKVFYPVMSFYGPLTGLGVLRRGIQVQRALVTPPERDDVLIQHLGVSEQMRGRGIGAALLNNGYDTARNRGFRRCIGDVEVTNPRAQALYERLGCRVIEERKWPITSSGVHLPDVRRVEKLLRQT